MSARALMDLGGKLLALADQTPADPPRVTPVVVEDKDLALEVLEPALRNAGGTVIDIPRVASQGNPDDARDDAREALIAQALVHPTPTGDREITFADDRRSRRRAFFTGAVDPDVGPPPHPLLGLATASIDGRLAAGGRLLVVVYTERELDDYEKPVAWRYACHTMPQTVGGMFQHVVVVVSAEKVEVDWHCVGDPSLRWATEQTGVLQRNLADTNRTLTHRLAERQCSHTVLFLAAGFSASMEMPMGNAMRNYALRRLLPGHAALEEHELPAKFYELAGDQFELLEYEQGRDPQVLASQLTFERVLREELRVFPAERPTLTELQRREGLALAATPRGAVRHLHRMLESARRLILITVNFDRLIEYHCPDLVEVFATDNDFDRCTDYLETYLAGSAADDKIPLLKLHGSFEDADSLVATIEQTLTGLTVDKAASLDRACTSATGPVPWMWVGSSMRDLDIVPHLSLPKFATLLDEEWVMPLPAPTVSDFVLQTRVMPWDSANVRHSLEERLISWTADEFFALLADAWDR